MSQKEPQEQRQGWAGPFWELRLPSCKCPGGEGTAGPRWAGTQLGTATGPHEQGNAACTSLRGSPTGTGRLGGPEKRVWGCQTPLFLSKNLAEAGQSLPLAGSKPCPVGCQLRTALAGPGRWGTPRHIPLGEGLGEPARSSPARRLPGLQEQHCADSAAAVSKLLRTGLGRLRRPPPPAKGQLASPLREALGFTAWPGDCMDSLELLPARDTQPSLEIPAAASFTLSWCWLKSLISLAGA